MANNFSDWINLGSIGEGGQAHILLAKNKDGNIGVIKRLKNINRKKRFLTEIESIKDDLNGFFPKIYETDIDSDKPYFVMEYFPKGGLSEKLIKNWSLAAKCKFISQTISAVAYAHTRNVIHRDLKPENILVSDENEPKITDFGICFIDDEGNRETLSEEAIGSFRYMAPELENGKSDLIGTYTDVYALGKVAYRLLAGGKIYNRERHRDPDYDLSKTIRDNLDISF